MMHNNDLMREMTRSRRADFSRHAKDEHDLREAGFTKPTITATTAELAVIATLTAITILLLVLL